MALTDYDKKNLSKKDQDKIQAATDKWNAANKKGDKAGMEAAAKEAATIRNNAGYKTDSSGNYTGSYTPTSSGSYSGSSSKGGNSPYTGSSNAVKVNTSYQQSLKDEMNANSIAWWSADANEKQRLEQRNQEISKKLGGTVSYNPTTGTWSGSAGGFDADDIVDWEYDEIRPTQPERDPRIDEYLNQILNRDDFSYDVMDDPLYHQYSEMYKREGDRATRETLAEAAAGAGGMNSYAITAAQQAGNYYNSQLMDKIPELYQLAYNMYLKDIEQEVQNLGILQDMDATQYNRYRDTMNDWYKDKSFAYGAYQDAVAQNNWKTNFDYSDEWKNKEWDAYLGEVEYNKSQDAYNKNEREQEKAQDLIAWYIQNGITIDAIDPEIIKQSGLSQTAINQMIANYRARQGVSGVSSGGGNPKPYIPANPTQDTTPIPIPQVSMEPTSFEKHMENIYNTQGAETATAALQDAMLQGLISMSDYMKLYNKYQS